MNPDPKTSFVLIGLAVVFLALQAAFNRELWGRPDLPLPPIPPVDPVFTNTATVRVSAAELFRTGGDTESFGCYTCHEKNKVLKLHLDANGNVILPKEHADLVLRHGSHNRNNNCYNCHDPENLEGLRTRDGRKLNIQESTLLCASCHGPTYRDWELGIHGRVSGYWNPKLGPVVRQDCVSCHHPHAPAFPALKPAPGPHPLHPGGLAESRKEKDH